jgi:hypothetical protein
LKHGALAGALCDIVDLADCLFGEFGEVNGK